MYVGVRYLYFSQFFSWKQKLERGFLINSGMHFNFVVINFLRKNLKKNRKKLKLENIFDRTRQGAGDGAHSWMCAGDDAHAGSCISLLRNWLWFAITHTEFIG